MDMGYVYPDPTKTNLPWPGRMGTQIEVAIRNDRAVTLDGSRLEITKFWGVTSSPLLFDPPAPKKPAPGR